MHTRIKWREERGERRESDGNGAWHARWRDATIYYRESVRVSKQASKQAREGKGATQ